MARAGGGGLEPASDDDLIEIHVNPGNRPRNNLENLLNPLRSFSPAQPVGLRPSRRFDRQRDPQRDSPSRWDQPAVPIPQPAAVIDLTQEPDSPEGQRLRQSQGLSGRNSRRTNSQQASPPRLARSDGTFVAPGGSFIDLTLDAPEENRAAEPPRQLRPRHHHHHHHHHHRHNRPNGVAHDQIIELEFINGGAGLYSNLARNVQHVAGLIGSELLRGGFNPPQLDFAGSFSPREPSPKPPMEDVPPTRDGFTRDTWTSSEDKAERIVICPACSDELAYDPLEAAAPSSAGGAKRRKRAPGEHHFWALKKCGHVYCADCFENRRPTKASPNGVGFCGPGGKAPSSAPNDLRCAVEGCETKVGAKTEWVGIFL